MKLLILVLMSQYCFGAYSFNRAVTVDHNKVATNDQVNFPVLVSGTYSYLADISHSGKAQSSSGYDIGFFTNPNCSTGKMKWETDLYNNTSGVVSYWVKVSSLSHTVDTIFYLCYGDSGISTDQSDKTNVWDANFKGVWHLSNGTTLTATDSTSTGSNGTVINATATAGVVDGAASFNGTNALVNLGNTISVTSPLTIEFWAIATSIGGTALCAVSKGYDGVNTQWIVATDLTNGTKMQFDTNNTGTHHGVVSGTSISTSVYQRWAVTYNGTTYRIFVNGVADGTSTDAVAPPTTSNKLEIGAVDVTGTFDTTFWTGKVDEVRISNSARPVDWLLTAYNSESSPSTFYGIGSESAVSSTRKGRVISQ